MPTLRRLTIVSLVLAATACGEAGAQASRSLAYATPDACISARILDAEECRRAFRNAAAELDEKAPRFPKRAECEAFFRRCMIGLSGAGPRDVYFTPQLREVRVSASARTALPVLYAAHPALGLSPRTIARPAEEVARARRIEAQARWAKRDEIEESPSAFDPSDAEGEPAPSRPGEITSWPVPPHLRPKLIDNP